MDGNLLALGGMDRKIKIYDRRESKIVKTFDDAHKSKFVINSSFSLITFL